jgi:hypothetical protein
MRESFKSRKIFAFGCVFAAVSALVGIATYLGTPENVTINALWIVGFCGLFTIGGQSLVDSIAKWKNNGQ